MFTAALGLLMGFSGPSPGAVRDVQSGSFHLETVVLIEAGPAATYRDLVRLPRWWDPEHTWSGSARNLSLEPRAGGCFCEKLADGGSVQHARVVFAQPGKLLRLEGAFGPLQEMPVQAVLTFTLAPDGPGTRVTMTYRAAGQFTMDTARLAPLVDQVLNSQLERFRASVKPRK
jgi:uncharacterized protein YndB with AHSA1/START domain